MSQINRAEYLDNELDKNLPYKIVAPKQSALPIRTNTKENALSIFKEITDQGFAAILTYNNYVTKTCTILKTGPHTIYNLAQEE
ncbi:hypothetical protein OHD16_06910 [Sphingobacterium sp. ML3W]|uniref:hypothetical protein n=1 Tax=Sphingobacterium sp. ML3W TaxID=1538644 RepID=UPI00249BF033|nr:hypothetical protein [Sphingobacterium sp. ML3W]WFA79700.1 hypothetical protein OGI71_00050 [Sphingobacterium sp. ML3W]